jgi:hypothetical protein
MADFVAKRFCLLERARLIQDHAPIRNVGSKIHTVRFIRFKFIFHSFATETFATKSALSGHAGRVARCLLWGAKRTWMTGGGNREPRVEREDEPGGRAGVCRHRSSSLTHPG